MKGLQWNKIPENKIKGTIFEKFELGKKFFSFFFRINNK